MSWLLSLLPFLNCKTKGIVWYQLMVCEVDIGHGGNFVPHLKPVLYGIAFICESIGSNVWIPHDLLKILCKNARLYQTNLVTEL